MREFLGDVRVSFRSLAKQPGLALLALGLGALLSRGLRQGFTLVELWDPSVFMGISLVLVTTAFMATIFPARRATRVDPVEALRDS
jgi:ABC-type lipoprotein release transport system permease subunit